MNWLIQILSHFTPITPTIHPTHIQSWAIEPRSKKR